MGPTITERRKEKIIVQHIFIRALTFFLLHKNPVKQINLKTIRANILKQRPKRSTDPPITRSISPEAPGNRPENPTSALNSTALPFSGPLIRPCTHTGMLTLCVLPCLSDFSSDFRKSYAARIVLEGKNDHRANAALHPLSCPLMRRPGRPLCVGNNRSAIDQSSSCASIGEDFHAFRERLLFGLSCASFFFFLGGSR